MKIAYNGFGEEVLTFATEDENIEKGTPIAFSTDGDGSVCSAADNTSSVVLGFAMGDVRNGTVAVKIKGYCEYDFGDEVSLGINGIVPDSAGIALSGEEDTQVREILVIKTNGTKAGFILM